MLLAAAGIISGVRAALKNTKMMTTENNHLLQRFDESRMVEDDEESDDESDREKQRSHAISSLFKMTPRRVLFKYRVIWYLMPSTLRTHIVWP